MNVANRLFSKRDPLVMLLENFFWQLL